MMRIPSNSNHAENNACPQPVDKTSSHLKLTLDLNIIQKVGKQPRIEGIDTLSNRGMRARHIPSVSQRVDASVARFVNMPKKSAENPIRPETADFHFKSIEKFRPKLPPINEEPPATPRIDTPGKFKPRLPPIREEAPVGPRYKTPEKFRPQLETVYEQPTLAQLFEAESSVGALDRQAPSLPLSLSLSETGKLIVDESGVSTAARSVLEKTLGNASQNYLAKSERGENTVLLDTKGRLFNIHNVTTGMTAVHSSQGATAVQNKNDLDAYIDNILPLPGKAQLACVNAVHQDKQGNAFRLEKGKLYQFDHDTKGWNQASVMDFSRLAVSANGNCYGIKQENRLSNLSAAGGARIRDTAPFDKPIKDFFIGKSESYVVLMKDENTMVVADTFRARAGQRTSVNLVLGEGQVKAESIAATADGYLASGADGGLYFAIKSAIQRDDVSGGLALNMRPVPQPHLERMLGGGYSFQGFINDERGGVGALVKDSNNQVHSCVLQPWQAGILPSDSIPQFKPEWNLSDALVIARETGLPRNNPAAASVLNLGVQGSVALEGGTLKFLDRATGYWRDTDITNLSQLKQGLDKNGYVLHEGEIKKIAVSDSSATIVQGNSNIFSLNSTRESVSVKDALKGLAEDEKVTAFAVINANKYVVHTEKGELRFTEVNPDGGGAIQTQQSLTKHGLHGELIDLQINDELDLFAVTKSGEEFRLRRDEWLQSDAAWTQLNNADHEPENAGSESSANNTSENFETVFNRLDRGEKAKLISSSGLTGKFQINALGMTNMEAVQVKSRTTDLVRAHIFKPDFEPPRAAEKLAHAIQHRWKGREGLTHVYEAQSQLFQRLDAAPLPRSAPQHDLATRIENLKLGALAQAGERGEALATELKALHRALVNNVAYSVTVIGQAKKAIDANNQVNENYEPSKYKKAKQSLNPYRSSHNLASEIHAHWQEANPDKNSRADLLLRKLTDLQLSVNHRKVDVPLGRNRDSHDKIDLVKARLVLDTLTISDLNQLVDGIEQKLKAGQEVEQSDGTGSAREGRLSEEDIGDFEKALSRLRDTDYEMHPVKRYTDMGFFSNRQLESSYNSVKTFLKAFRDTDKAANVTLRTAIEAGDLNAMNEKLKQTVSSLKTGDSITVQRNYGGSVGMVYVPPMQPVPVVPIAGVSQGRGYAMALTRNTNGINVTFSGGGNRAGSIGVAAGYNLMELFGSDVQVKLTDDGEHALGLEVRLGANVIASIARNNQKSLNFTISEDEVGGFIDALCHGNISPEKIINSGHQHKTTQTNSVTFDINTAFSAEVRGNVNITAQEASPLSSLARASVGVTASVNLMSANRDRGTTQGINDEGERHKANDSSNNRPRFFSLAALKGEAKITHVGLHASNTGVFPVSTDIGVDASLNVNDKTSKSFSFTFARAKAVSDSDIDAVIAELSGSFQDANTAGFLNSVKSIDNKAEKLDKLNLHFSNKKVDTNSQYAAQQQLQRLVVRNSAAENNGNVLSDASYTTTYTNLTRLDQRGLLARLSDRINPQQAKSNAEVISALAKDNDALARLLQTMQTQPNCYAKVKLELKDETRNRIEKGSLDGSMSQRELVELLKERNNLRIKSISVTRSVSLNEGFSSPVIVAGYKSSASVIAEKTIGSIDFEYGMDQSKPKGYTVSGEVARPDPDLTAALKSLEDEGYRTNHLELK